MAKQIDKYRIVKDAIDDYFKNLNISLYQKFNSFISANSL